MARFLIAAGALAFVLGAAGNATAQTEPCHPENLSGTCPVLTIVSASGDESVPVVDAAGNPVLDAAGNPTESAGAIEFLLSTGGVPVEQGVTVRYVFKFDETATSADLVRPFIISRPGRNDYTSSSLNTTLSIPRGGSRAAIRVPISNDAAVEGDETFTLTISTTSRYARIPGDSRTVRGTIRANDNGRTAPPNTVSIRDASGEEDRGSISFEVRLGQVEDADVNLRVAVRAGSRSDAVTLADDLGSPRPTRVTIPKGDISATITVPIKPDQDIEGNETFSVTISERTSSLLPAGVAIGTRTATGTIVDDDAPPVATTPTVRIAPETVAEDVPGGNAVFTVTLSAAVDSAVELDVAVTAGSTNPATVSGAGADLGTLPPATVTIPQGSLTATITVPIVDDDIADEGNETFTVTISDTDSSLDGVVTISGGGTATGTITDDDATDPPAAPTVSIGPVTVAEDVSGGNAVFTVTLSAAVDSAVELDVAVTAGSTNPATVSGAGADLGTLPPATVTIPQGSLTATITVPIVDDDIADEGNETFTVTISDTDGSLDGVVTISGGGTATGTITDDDSPTPPTPDITVSVADAQASEGEMITFTVTSSAPVPSEVALLVTLEGSGDNPALVRGDEADLTIPRLGIEVTIAANSAVGTFSVPTVEDDLEEMNETFTATLTPGFGGLPSGVVLPDEVEGPFGPRRVATATGTIIDSGASEALLAAREIGAGTALRRHAGRFDSLTGAVVRNRLDARATRRLSASENVGNGAVAAGGGLGETRWGAWIDGAWAGFDGKASGRQADVYGGVDYRAGDWLIGALIGYETADLDIGDATYRSNYTQLGVYGGARLSERLLFDGAATYGTATPDISQGNVSASYDAHRITVRGALTGDFGLEYGRGIKVQPRLGVLVSREQLDESAGGEVGRETLRLGRFSAGPRLTWEFDGGQVAGGVRAQWDFLQLDDGVGNRISGAADIGVNLDLTPNVTLGVQGDVDGIGISDDFGSLGGRIKLDVRF